MGRKEFLDSLKINKNSERYTSKKFDFDKLQKNVKKLLAVGALGITVLGFTGCGSKTHNEPLPQPGPVINTDNTTENPYKHLNSSDAVLQDFKERYLEEYNEVNGTNINAEDIKIVRSSTDYLYEINGKYVTHGAHPYETEEVLKEVGTYGHVVGNIKIYQIIDKTSGQPLESYAKGLSNNHQFVKSPVYSGNHLETLQKKLIENTNINSILAKYCDGFDLVVDINSADELSQTNKDAYIDFVESLDPNVLGDEGRY